MLWNLCLLHVAQAFVFSPTAALEQYYYGGESTLVSLKQFIVPA
jgi:hypothetical protein